MRVRFKPLFVYILKMEFFSVGDRGIDSPRRTLPATAGLL